MYKVIRFFTDLQDGEHPYDVGNTFPREGIEVTEERLAELAGPSNRQGVPLIELVDEDKGEEAVPEGKPKRTRKKATE